MATGPMSGTKRAGALATGVAVQRKTGCTPPHTRPTTTGTTPLGVTLMPRFASTKQYAEAQQLIHDDGGAIVAMWANFITAHSKAVTHGEEVAANWQNDGNKLSERWWFA